MAAEGQGRKQHRLGRLRDSSQFQTLLRRQPVAVSPHFAIYFDITPRRASEGCAGGPAAPILLTDQGQHRTTPVDNNEVRLGIVVPKRLSRRAVTRSLLKRQIRAAATRELGQLMPGICIIRQRTAFQSALNGPAASDELKLAARLELTRLLESLRGKSQLAQRCDE